MSENNNDVPSTSSMWTGMLSGMGGGFGAIMKLINDPNLGAQAQHALTAMAETYHAVQRMEARLARVEALLLFQFGGETADERAEYVKRVAAALSARATDRQRPGDAASPPGAADPGAGGSAQGVGEPGAPAAQRPRVRLRNGG